jgi:uncharacterized protein (DUF58 family)
MNGLLPSSFRHRLTKHRLLAQKRIRGTLKGERRSSALGSSLEFSDYRQYQPGDDLRQIDWNAYARSQKYYIKRFLDEQELNVSILVDCSKSMGIHEDKWFKTKQIAAAFSLICLHQDDRVSVLPVPETKAPLTYKKGRAYIPTMLSYAQELTVETSSKVFFDSIKNQSSRRKSGLTIIISDCLEPVSSISDSLTFLQARKQPVLLLQLLLPTEINPEIKGDLKLIDIENSDEKDVSMSRSVRKQYHNVFSQHCGQLQSFCYQRGIGYVQCTTNESLEEIFFQKLLARGWLK